MKNLLRIILVFFLLKSLPTLASVEPERTVENVSDGVIVTYTFGNTHIEPCNYAPGTFTCQYEGFGVTDEAGKPATPFRRDMFVIPSGYFGDAQIIEATYRDTVFLMAPALPPMFETDSIQNYQPISPYSGFFPNEIVDVDTLRHYRGVNLQRVTINPIQYNSSNNVVRIYTKIKYKLCFEEDLFDDTANWLHPHANNDDLGDFLSGLTLNYSPSLFPNSSPRLSPDSDTLHHSAENSQRMLIVTTDEYREIPEFRHFVEWKNSRGIKVYIESKNKGEWTPDDVKETVEDYFLEHAINYLLIIGGIEDVPAFPSVKYGANRGVSDFKYGLPVSEYDMPQIYRGRIPVRNKQDLFSILYKITQYEKRPSANPEFYKTGVVCSYFQDDESPKGYEDRAFTLTCENVREHLVNNYGMIINRAYTARENANPQYWNESRYSNGGRLPDELMRPLYEWKTNQDTIISYINRGTLFVLHRDHGSVQSWIHPSFTINDIDSLKNGALQPIVFSINCQTGSYQNESPCFAEQFLKRIGRGCIAIIAATSKSLSGYNDVLTLNMFDAVWPGLRPTYFLQNFKVAENTSTAVDEIGKVFEQGIIRLNETYGNIKPRIYTSQIFHCYGDPSMKIYTEKPQLFETPLVYYSGDSICVLSKDGDCQITFYEKGRNDVKSYYGNYATYGNPTDSIVICLTRHNYKPYIAKTYNSMLYIQNEEINGAQRVYHANKVYIGSEVTDDKEHGAVKIMNSNIKISSKMGTRISPETYIENSNVIFCSPDNSLEL